MSGPDASVPFACTLQVTDSAEDDIRKLIASALIRYNVGLAGPSQQRSLAVVVRDSGNAVVGGLWGSTGYGWLYTQMLLVPEGLRGQGLGRTIMQRAEEEALERGCQAAWVDTQFGAKGFYESLGYESFGELPDYPPGFSRTFLRKSLTRLPPDIATARFPDPP
ncbi:MAG: GNAT family N-acetyltransferase [Comamonadaceae bacterium]|jgi:GNAT superfamily N-acetyltransferase